VNAPAIEVADVSKRFRVYRDKPTSLKQRVLSSRTKAEDFWALRDIALDVGEGSTFGLIGHNGSGKTTLLKCVAGILRPTSGTIRQRGRLAALLELGAGFHPQLTGRENVYLNARSSDCRATTPRSATSSRVRGARDVHRQRGEVLLVGHAGPAGVRGGRARRSRRAPDRRGACGRRTKPSRPCLDRIRAFQRDGRTIVIVTHALDTVIEICDRAAMLHHGELHAIGMPSDVVREMRYVLLGVTDPNFVPEEGTREAEIAEVQIVRPNGSSEGAILRGDPLTIVIDVRQNEPLDDLDVDFAVLDGATNHAVLDARTSRAGLDLGRFDKKRVRFRIEGFPYEPGKYWVTVGLSNRSTGHLYHVQTQRYLFEVFDAPRVQELVEVPVAVEVEDL
jgi:ABC-2 type transport system ATP-binding protein